jgi:hypothetical protein
MNPIVPVPDVLPLPAPLWLLEFLLIFTFILHIVPMNFLFGGGFLAALSHMLSKKNPNHERLARRISELMPSVIAAAVTLGVAPLLFVQVLYGHFLYSSSILMAEAWFWVIPLVIIGYYLAYLLRFKWEALGGLRITVAWVTALIFATIGFIYSNNFSLMLRPDNWGPHYFQDLSRGHLNWGDSTLYPRYLHMLFGAAAVAGVWIMIIGARRKSGSLDWSNWALKYGAKIFMHATMLNIVIGFWYLITLPKRVMMIFMGENPAATAILVIALLLTVIAWILMSRATSVTDGRVYAYSGSGTLLAVLALMAVMRQQVRTATLEPYFKLEQLQSAPQWGPFTMFVITLLIGLVLFAWLVRVILRASPAKV